MKSKIIISAFLSLCAINETQAKLPTGTGGINAVRNLNKYIGLKNSNEKLLLAQYMNKSKLTDLDKFAKKTGTLSRLIAVATWAYDSTHRPNPKDSSRYVFSGSNGGDLNSTWILCDNQTIYTYAAGIYSNNTLVSQLIGGGAVISQDIQTYNGASWDNNSVNNYGYDVSGNLTSIIVENWNNATGTYDNANKYEYTYDPLNNPTSETDYNWSSSSSSWIPTNRYVYTYAGSQLTTYTGAIWNATTSNWDNYSDENFRYDTRGNLLVDIYRQWDPSVSAYVNVNELVYTYSGTLILNTANNLWNTTTNTWDFSTLDNFDYDKANNVISDIQQVWHGGNYINSSEYVSSYNTFDQQTIISSHSWAGGWVNNAGDVFYNLYYENYQDKPTGVTNVNSNISNVVLFPCPANNMLSLKANWQNAENFSVSIYDVEGRVMKSWSEAGTQNYQKAISVSNLANGNYFLHISSQSGVFTSQFTVQH